MPNTFNFKFFATATYASSIPYTASYNCTNDIDTVFSATLS